MTNIYLTEKERKEARKVYKRKWRQENAEKIKEQAKQYYQANREKILEQQKQYKKENSEQIKEYNKQYNKQYRQENAEQIKEYNKKYNKQYYQTNRERIKKQTKQYYQDNSERCKERMKQYSKTPMGRASYLIGSYNQNDKKYNRGQGDLTAKWIVENIFTKPCAHCGKEGWEVIGCNRLDNSLPHTMDNVEPCCKECNDRLSALDKKKWG